MMLIDTFQNGNELDFSRLYCLFRPNIACSRLSDSGQDAKEKGTLKVGGAKKRKRKGEREPVIISLTTLFRPLLARLR